MNLMHELYERERHADFVREAEQDRLKQTNQKSRKASKFAARIYKPALGKLGATLVDVGNRLQDHVEGAKATPMLKRA